MEAQINEGLLALRGIREKKRGKWRFPKSIDLDIGDNKEKNRKMIDV